MLGVLGLILTVAGIIGLLVGIGTQTIDIVVIVVGILLVIYAYRGVARL